MKKTRKKISILLSIIIIMVFPKLSICKDNKNNFYIDQSRGSYEEWDRFWQENEKLPTKMCISPGSDESMINFAWYSKVTDSPSKFKFYYGDEEKNIGVDSINIGNGFISNKVEVKGLRANRNYYYSYSINDKWIKPVLYTTKALDKFSIIFMGDPQIGASYKSKDLSSYEEAIKLDSYNWNQVIEKSLQKRNKISFILCGGDETNTKNNYSDKSKEIINQMEYCGFLYPKALRYIPIANAIGNHDEENIDFYYHFNTPNPSNLGKTKAGGDYYFKYNNTLFLILNTNNLNIDEHEQFIKNATRDSGMKWKIAVFHHDIYGGGTHSEDKDILLLREKLPSILEENNINLVLNGHDHIYSRTYPLINNEIGDNSKGITYITGSTSTGSKFYKKISNEKKYTKTKFQKEIPTYTIIDISDDEIIINTYRVDNDDSIDNEIKIKTLATINRGLFYKKESFILRL